MNVPIGIDFRSIQFGEPRLLWLLVIPAGLLLLWVWQVAIRRADGRRYARVRTVPVRERVTLLGGLLFWWCAIAATSFVIVALIAMAVFIVVWLVARRLTAASAGPAPSSP